MCEYIKPMGLYAHNKNFLPGWCPVLFSDEHSDQHGNKKKTKNEHQ